MSAGRRDVLMTVIALQSAAQSVQIGFVGAVVPVVLLAGGRSLGDLVAFQLLLLVPLLKVLWAPLTDRYDLPGVRGRRRSWLVHAGVVNVLLVACLLFVDPTSLTTLASLLLAASGVSSTADTALDALSVTVVDERRRRVAGAVQSAAGFVGTAAGGGLGLVLYRLGGWEAAVLLVLVVVAAPLPALLMHVEPRPDREPSSVSGLWRGLGRTLRQGCRRDLGVVVAAMVPTGALGALNVPVLVDAGLSPDVIGLTHGVIGAGAGLVGAALAGRVALHVSRDVLVTGSVALTSVSAAVLACAVGRPLAGVAVVITMFAVGAGLTTSMIVLMAWSRRAEAAVDFSTLSGIGFAASFGSGALWVVLAQQHGLAGALVLAAALGSVLTGFVLRASAVARRGPP